MCFSRFWGVPICEVGGITLLPTIETGGDYVWGGISTMGGLLGVFSILWITFTLI